MIRIALLKNRSLFIILLASSTVNPLLALPVKNQSIVKRSVKSSKLSQAVQNTLINKGLEKEVALGKVNKLFSSIENFENKLTYIYASGEFSISKEKLHNTLMSYALYEKNLDLNSYSGVLGFIQSASLQKLDSKQLNSIKKIAVSA